MIFPAKKIGIDIDDTLYSFTELARDELMRYALEADDQQAQRAAYAPWPEWRSPPDLIGVDAWLKIIDRCHSDEAILSRSPYDNAVETIWKILKAGNQIVYISNRNDDRHNATQQWLNKHNFPTGKNTRLLCTTNDKIKEVYDCHYLIDDRPKTLVSFVNDFTWKNTHGSNSKENGRKAFGLQKEFNKNLSDVPNIYLAPSWRGIRHYLEKKKVI